MNPLAQERQAVVGEARRQKRRAQGDHRQAVCRIGPCMISAVRDGDRMVLRAVDRYWRWQTETIGTLLFHEFALFRGLHISAHLRKRRDACDRLLAERPGKSDGSQELVIDIDRAAAHAGNDACLLQIETGKPAKDHVAAWTRVLENTEHFRFEIL